MSGSKSRSCGYTFGDSDRAARRLALLADVLAGSSRSLLVEAHEGRRSPRLALDLGCGPGFTTALVAAASGAMRTLGLDCSEAFVAAACRAHPDLAFVVHDVTVQPFPEGPADLAYARLVLAHLPDPAGQARAWAGALGPAGRLVLEETEWLDTSNPVLARYEQLVLPVVAERGAPLYAGPAIATFDDPASAVRVSRVRAVQVPIAASARIHELNLQVWRADPYAQQHYDPGELDELAARLRALAARGGSPTVWGVRQVILERVA